MKGGRVILGLGLACGLAGCANSPFHKQSMAANDVSPRQLMALQQGAAMAYAQGNATAATGLYTQLVQSAPNDALAWHRLGNLELLEKHYGQALIAYGHALQLGGGNAGIWHNIAIIRLREAQAALIQVQAQPPDPADEPVRANSARATKVLSQVLALLSSQSDSVQSHPATAEGGSQ